MSSLEIKKIDIKNFGWYKDYLKYKKNGIGNDFNSGEVKIFYGRKYYGKSK